LLQGAPEQLLPETLLATAETVDVLPASGPYSDYDLSIVGEIVRLAEETAQQDYAAGRGSSEVTLVRLLQAYEAVLPAHGVVPAEDVFYYRLLLKLSLDPNPDWYAKLEQQRPHVSRCVAGTSLAWLQCEKHVVACKTKLRVQLAGCCNHLHLPFTCLLDL
jgi:hypothetical protein